jgi:MFS family permease
VAREIAAEYPVSTAREESSRSLYRILTSPGALVAIVSMVVGQGVMVLVMGMTSLHMRSHDYLLASISVVMSAHTFGMFAFSIISGRLTDLWGRVPVILSGAGTLVAGCVAAALSTEIVPLSVSLFFVGLGWNLCYVGGSALLSDELTPEERSRTQGVNDLLIYVSTAAVSIGSGILFATVGYRGIGIVGAAVSLALLVSISSWTFIRKTGLGATQEPST